MNSRLRYFLVLVFVLLGGALAFGSAQAATLASQLSGRILLQVESKGEAWYVNPKDYKRYYLGRPDDAYKLMRSLSTGISEKEFANWKKGAPSWAKGRLYFRPESHGEAYYVDLNRRWHYLGRPLDAWLLFRAQGLGVTNATLTKIINAATVVTPEKNQTATTDYTAVFSWRYDLQKYEFSLPLKSSLYSAYNSSIKTLYYTDDADKAAVRNQFYSFFFNFKNGDTAVSDLVAYGRKIAASNSWSNDKLAEFLLALVQYIPYDESKVTQNLLEPNYPYETLYKNSGICSDKTFLAVAILRQLGYGAAILDFPNLNHSAAGISCPLSDSVNNSGYCYVETTGYFPIGVIPPSISNGKAVIGQDDLDSLFNTSHLSSMEVYQKTTGFSYQGVSATKSKVASIKAISDWINNEEASLAKKKSELTTQQTTLLGLKNQLDSYEASGNITAYNSIVDSYNTGVVKYNSDLAAYRDRLTIYNNKINDYNQAMKNFYQQ